MQKCIPKFTLDTKINLTLKRLRVKEKILCFKMNICEYIFNPEE